MDVEHPTSGFISVDAYQLGIHISALPKVSMESNIPDVHTTQGIPKHMYIRKATSEQVHVLVAFSQYVRGRQPIAMGKASP